MEITAIICLMCTIALNGTRVNHTLMRARGAFTTVLGSSRMIKVEEGDEITLQVADQQRAGVIVGTDIASTYLSVQEI